MRISKVYISFGFFIDIKNGYVKYAHCGVALYKLMCSLLL